jgi:hypothetical protein
MVGSQLIEEIKRRGIGQEERGIELQRMLEPYRDVEVPPHVAQMVQEEIDAAMARPAASSPIVPTTDTVSRHEFDELVDRVSMLEEEIDSNVVESEEKRMGAPVPQRLSFVPPSAQTPMTHIPAIPRDEIQPSPPGAVPSVGQPRPVSDEDLRLKAQAEEQSQEDQKQVDQVLSEIQTIKGMASQQPHVGGD